MSYVTTIAASLNTQRPQEVPQVHMGGKDLSIHMSSLRPLQCPKGVHKAFKAGDGSPPEAGPQVSDLFRRPPLDGPGKGVPGSQGSTSGGTAGRSGIHGELGKISPITNSGDSIPGIYSEFKDNEVPFAPARRRKFIWGSIAMEFYRKVWYQ